MEPRAFPNRNRTPRDGLPCPMSRTSKSPPPTTTRPQSGLAQGGLGGPEDELLEDGQEEVFSRYEVEHGLIEHHTDAGGEAVAPNSPPLRKP